MSPDFDRDGTLYASVRGLGIYKTIDKGKKWQPANSGLSFLNEFLIIASRFGAIRFFHETNPKIVRQPCPVRRQQLKVY